MGSAVFAGVGESWAIIDASGARIREARITFGMGFFMA
jgi:hypothetical protein